MNRWEKPTKPSKPSRQDRFRHRRENPSFSSILLDSIYRSIDQIDGGEIMKKKHSNGFKEEVEKANYERACMIEKWMEKKVSEKVVIRRKSRDSVLLNSSSSSSESSFGCGISSNDWCAYNMDKPKSIRPVIERGKIECGFVKTKSKALKIYGDLKKVKQPISPGGRLASFLHSIFNGGSQKKVKISDESRGKSVNTSTCSSASSFSRSCLSKNLSSRGKLSDGIKRSVRFLDEDQVFVKSSVNVNDEVVDFFKSYKKKIDSQCENEDEDEDDDDDDDDMSCSSSDLFELDFICGNGIERYREELPVYETTHFDTNRAIANGTMI